MKNDLMIFEHREQAVVSSRIIADRFNKRHDNLLRDIAELIGGLLKNEETPRNFFIRSDYKDE